MDTQTITCNCKVCTDNAKRLGRDQLTIRWTPKNETYANAWADKHHVLVYEAFHPVFGRAIRARLNIELA